MLKLQELTPAELTIQEKESILNHAIDLHLIGSDEVDDPGFDIVEKGSPRAVHILRLVNINQHVGIMYILQREAENHFEMTILVHKEFRGKHLTADAVDALEQFMSRTHKSPVYLCASVREHNPLRHELTAFLLRHGYTYSSEEQAFIKQVV
ncbi:MAG: hypothetical protein HY707_01500 [Ignavibacteriae bacterium]|nr:hypothetical protein [Ignavibacteriota bacterium]